MNNKNYPIFIEELKNYLIGIKNLSNLYVDNIITTIMQFLEFMNTYKFNEQFESLEQITCNDIRSLSNSDI